jgi:hypothetical protein
VRETERGTGDRPIGARARRGDAGLARLQHRDLGIDQEQAAEPLRGDDGMRRLTPAAAELDRVAQRNRPARPGGLLDPREQVGRSGIVPAGVATIAVRTFRRDAADEIGNAIDDRDIAFAASATQQVGGDRGKAALAMRAVQLVRQFHRALAEPWLSAPAAES